MISDPEPIIQQQNANTDPYSIRGERAFQQPMLQRSMPPWMQRQALPPAQPPMPRPQMGMAGGGAAYGAQMPQWAPPWMTGQWGPPQGMGAMGGGMYGGNGGGGVYNDPGFGGGYSPPQYSPPQQNFGGYGPPGGMMQSTMGSGYYGQGQSYGGPYGPPGYQQQQQQYRAPNGNTGIAGPMTNQAAPQYSRQSYQPQPAGTVNQASSAPPPQQQQQQQQNRQAAITPTPIFRNTGNDLA